MRKPEGKLDLALDALIVLAVLVTLAEDACAAAGAAWSLRRVLSLAGLAVDAIFTLEFAARLAAARLEGRAGAYMGRGLGWVDLLASVPLLVFVSGPFLYGSLTGVYVTAGGFAALASARLLKSLRVLRTLRLLRLLRLSSARGVRGGWRREAAVATDRHVARASSIAVACIVAAAFAASAASALGLLPDASWAEAASRRALTGVIAASPDPVAASAALASAHPELLQVSVAGRPVWARYGSGELELRFGPDEFGHETAGLVEVFFSITASNRALAASSLASALSALLAVAVIVLAYGSYFARGVAAPVQASLRYLRGEDSRVRSLPPPGREDEEPFLLAEELDRQALAGDPPDAAGRAELEGLLSKASPLSPGPAARSARGRPA